MGEGEEGEKELKLHPSSHTCTHTHIRTHARLCRTEANSKTFKKLVFLVLASAINTFIITKKYILAELW